MKINVSKQVAEYIAQCPKEVQGELKKIRAAMKEAAPGAQERMDYFKMPGYSYDGEYDYSGMFAWFSYKKPFMRIHIRPEAIAKYTKELTKYKKSRGIIYFPDDAKAPLALVKKLTKTSVKVMKDKAKIT